MHSMEKTRKSEKDPPEDPRPRVEGRCGKEKEISTTRKGNRLPQFIREKKRGLAYLEGRTGGRTRKGRRQPNEKREGVSYYPEKDAGTRMNQNWARPAKTTSFSRMTKEPSILLMSSKESHCGRPDISPAGSCNKTNRHMEKRQGAEIRRNKKGPKTLPENGP